MAPSYFKDFQGPEKQNVVSLPLLKHFAEVYLLWLFSKKKLWEMSWMQTMFLANFDMMFNFDYINDNLTK